MRHFATARRFANGVSDEAEYNFDFIVSTSVFILEDGSEEIRYRVRWEGSESSTDTHEPASSFHPEDLEKYYVAKLKSSEHAHTKAKEMVSNLKRKMTELRQQVSDETYTPKNGTKQKCKCRARKQVIKKFT